MLYFKPQLNITAWELCQVSRLAGSISPGEGVHNIQLDGKGKLMRHFVCDYYHYEMRVWEATDCEACEYCEWASLMEEAEKRVVVCGSGAW